MRAAAIVLAFLTSGCAIAERSDKFGADLDVGIGGLLSYVADFRLKASIGFSKTCYHKEDRNEAMLRNPGAHDRGFL